MVQGKFRKEITSLGGICLLLMGHRCGQLPDQETECVGDLLVEVDVEGVFQLLFVILALRRSLLWGLHGGCGCGGSLCGLFFVVLFAHVEGSDGGIVIVEPIGGLLMRMIVQEEMEVVVGV